MWCFNYLKRAYFSFLVQNRFVPFHLIEQKKSKDSSPYLTKMTTVYFQFSLSCHHNRIGSRKIAQQQNLIFTSDL